MLDDVKVLLGFGDSSQDKKLNAIIRITERRLLNLIKGIDAIPDELEYIVTEVTISRFNRIGSEGATAHSVAGENVSYSDDDFAPYRSDIQAYLDGKEGSRRGKVVFL